MRLARLGAILTASESGLVRRVTACSAGRYRLHRPTALQDDSRTWWTAREPFVPTLPSIPVAVAITLKSMVSMVFSTGSDTRMLLPIGGLARETRNPASAHC